MLLKGVQYLINDIRTPLLPPNRFLYIDNNGILNITDIDEARCLYRRHAVLRANRYKKRCYVTGAIYTELFHDCCDFINPIPGQTIEIDIDIGCNTITKVKIIYDVNSMNEYLVALNTLGKTLKEYNDNTSRRNNLDMGKMIVIGEGTKGNGSYGIYSITNSTDAITDATLSVTNLAEDYYIKNGFVEEIRAIRDKSQNRGMCNNNFFVSSIVQSTDLVNAAHIDINDATECISTWTETDIGTSNNWYFILPNTTRDGGKAVIIKLKHGVTIKWDGRKLMHCSTVGDTGDNNHVFGTFFCARK